MSGPVFTVEMLAGGNGDALWIEYGDPDRPFRILVDGGTEPTRTTLAARFGALPDDQRHVELLIVTHIDGDHIGGILDFLEKQMVPVTFGMCGSTGTATSPTLPSSRWARCRGSASPTSWWTRLAGCRGTRRSTGRPWWSRTRTRMHQPATCPPTSSRGA